jgi:hypothetical protein
MLGTTSESHLLAQNHAESSKPTGSAAAKLERMSSVSKARPKYQEKHTTSPDEGHKLKSWPDDIRGAPNEILRSALFGALGKGSRALLEKESIMSPKGQQIRYTGTRLDQIDLTIWLCLLHLARQQTLGQELSFKAYNLLKLMRKTDTGKNRKILHERLLRLKSGGFEITKGNLEYKGRLIGDVYQDARSLAYVLILDAKLHLLFPKDGFTYVNWVIRSALYRQPLAQWLHGFYSSHAKPYPMKVETLQKLCGSEATETWKFTQTLLRALTALSTTCSVHHEKFSYDIRGDLVYVERQPSASQLRHIAKSFDRSRKDYRSSG